MVGYVMFKEEKKTNEIKKIKLYWRTVSYNFSGTFFIHLLNSLE